MPFKKSQTQKFVKITVWFLTGKKTYTMTVDKKKDFLAKNKKRNDVIKTVCENIRVYIS